MKRMNRVMNPAMNPAIKRTLAIGLGGLLLASQAAAVDLTMWVMPVTINAQKDVLSVLKPYLDKHKDVNIKVTVLDWESGWNKITAAAASKQGPDLLELGTTWSAAIAAMGGLEALSDDQLKQVDNGKVFYPALWNTNMIYGKKQVYGLPWYGDAHVAYYRTDVFKQAGVDPKKAFSDWDSFQQALKKINGTKVASRQVAALGYAGKNDWNVVHNLAPWIWNAGGDMLTADGTKSALDSPEALSAIHFYSSLAADGLVPRGALEKDGDVIESGFVAGDFGVIFSGPWMVKKIQESAAQKSPAFGNYDVAPYPAGKNGSATFFGGSNLAIFKASKNKAAAWDVMNYLAGKEAQISLARLSTMLPVRMDAASDPALTGSNPAYAKILTMANNGRAYPSIPAWGPLEGVYTKHLGGIAELSSGVNGKYTEEAMRKKVALAVKEANKVLKDAR